MCIRDSKGTGDTITITGAAASAASATATGVLKLFSNTVQSTGANEVTSTNGRTYGLQVDSSGRGVVNIPWTDTDTNTQRAAGTGLSLSGNTINANVGATGTTQAPQSISTTSNRLYQVETDDQDNLVVNVPWQDTNTNTDTLQNITNDTTDADRFITFVTSATGAQTGKSQANFKFNPNSGTLYVPNIVVSGDSTISNETVKVIEDNTLQFEGAAGSGANDELNLTCLLYTSPSPRDS